eukprot:gene24860-10763_t
MPTENPKDVNQSVSAFPSSWFNDTQSLTKLLVSIMLLALSSIVNAEYSTLYLHDGQFVVQA